MGYWELNRTLMFQELVPESAPTQCNATDDGVVVSVSVLFTTWVNYEVVYASSVGSVAAKLPWPPAEAEAYIDQFRMPLKVEVDTEGPRPVHIITLTCHADPDTP